MNLKQKLFVVLLFSQLCIFALYCETNSQDIFSAPCLCTSEEWQEELKYRDLDMCFNFGKNTYLKFNCTDEKVYFEIALGDLSEEYAPLLERLKKEFDLKYRPETHQYLFSYQRTQDGQETVNHFMAKKDVQHAENSAYIIADRRVFENSNPQQITEADLQRILKGHDVLFYTGAGLSIAAGVPDMQKLVELLEIEANENFLPSLISVYQNPQKFAEKIMDFHEACTKSSPTQAHHSLKNLAIAKNSRILTENLDCLHELSGLIPYRIHPKELREEGVGEVLKHYDYLICVGLSCDDRGFINWYKQNNPEGTIISIDLKQPSYLDNNDLLLIGDLQKIIPNLEL